MIVVPIVISALIVAVAGVGDMKKLGKLGGRQFFISKSLQRSLF